jgi:hypothetical protein
MKLAGTIPHPSPVLVFVENFVRPKIASREPCQTNKHNAFLLKARHEMFRMDQNFYYVFLKCFFEIKNNNGIN